MEKPKKAPERHFDLRDPKLPAIHAEKSMNRVECQVCPAPVPSQEIEPNRHEL